MKRRIKCFTIILTVVSAVLFSLIIYGNISLPDKAETINTEIVFSGIYTVRGKTDDVTEVSSSDPEKTDKINTDIKLFGAIPVKNIELEKSERKYVAVGGELIGIRLKTEGVLVVGTQSFQSDDGTVCPAEKAGISVGDTLISIDGKKISLNSELSQAFAESDGKEMNIVIIRDGKEMTLKVTPEKDVSTGIYKGGLWIRDSTGGIGTLTYTDISTGALAALGHGIYDVDTGKLMPTLNGIFVSASLSGITKGTNGTAGELRGSLGNEFIGDISINCENGIYGKTAIIKNTDDVLPVALADEIRTGKAQIISTVQGNNKCYYDIEIEKISADEYNRNMTIKITDEDLLSLTGGIVQGMSGSPIIQNGMFVGAVTHVFLNDPTKGYAILAENMVELSENNTDIDLQIAA